jgi:hypothetical protein
MHDLGEKGIAYMVCVSRAGIAVHSTKSTVSAHKSWDGPLGAGASCPSPHTNGMRYDIELKTPNTSWRMPGVENATRPITMNIASIVQDALKLRACPGRGIVSFVLFPVPCDGDQWQAYLDRIAHTLKTSLSDDEHCAHVCVPLGKNQACDVLYVASPIPPRRLSRKGQAQPL